MDFLKVISFITEYLVFIFYCANLIEFFSLKKRIFNYKKKKKLVMNYHFSIADNFIQRWTECNFFDISSAHYFFVNYGLWRWWNFCKSFLLISSQEKLNFSVSFYLSYYSNNKFIMHWEMCAEIFYVTVKPAQWLI